MSTSEADPIELVGRQAGNYLLTAKVGQGGMSTVYRGRDVALERDVAVKVLNAELALDDESRRRFIREARSAARLKHPSVVAIYDVGELEGRDFIVMEWVDGESLATLLARDGRMTLKRVDHIVGQLAGALDAAHADGIVHRDVKPSNVIVGQADTVTLTDFGLAKVGDSTQITRMGTLLGSPAYMSPEQVRGETVGPASDIYGLALTTYELLAGHRPFHADAYHALLHAQVYDKPASGKLYGLSPTVDALLQQALAKDPRLRPATAGEFAIALHTALTERQDLRSHPSRPTTHEDARSRPHATSESWRPLAAGLGFAIVIVLALLVITRAVNIRAAPSGTLTGAPEVVVATPSGRRASSPPTAAAVTEVLSTAVIETPTFVTPPTATTLPTVLPGLSPTPQRRVPVARPKPVVARPTAMSPTESAPAQAEAPSNDNKDSGGGGESNDDRGNVTLPRKDPKKP